MLKAEAINQAYAEIRISGLTTQEVPEEMELALRELDQVMWQWQAMGRDVNYNFPAPTPGQELVVSDPTDLFGVFPWAIQGVVCTLAKNLVSYFGKEIPPALAGKARFGVNVIKQRTFKAPPIPYPNRMPIGSGNNQQWAGLSPRFYNPTYTGRAPVDVVVQDQVADFYFDFSNDLPDPQALVSYTIELLPATGSAISLVSSSQDGNVVNYRVQGAEGWSDVVVFCSGTRTDGTTIPKAQRFRVLNDQLAVQNA